jgi:pyruvate dehydrogenase E2 component (dihydrolipoamide acetyltransferase)
MNIKLGKKQRLTSYRKIAIASWRHPRDPSTYAMLDLPMEAAQNFLADNSGETKLTLTHFVTKIAADCLARNSELNHVLRMGDLYERKSEDVFVTTLLKGEHGKDLSGFIIRDVNKKSIGEVATFSKERSNDLRYGRDEENAKVQKIVNPLPSLLLRPLLLLQEFLQFSLNLACPPLGLAKDRFGSVMITNIGALGIENAFIPLSPYSRCPLIIGVGKPRQVPVVKDDEVVVGQSVMITFTFDHRYADGAHGSHLMRRFKKIFADPAAFEEMFRGE